MSPNLIILNSHVDNLHKSLGKQQNSRVLQGLNFSAETRNSAVFPRFWVIPEISANQVKKSHEGGGRGISETTCPTEVVHLSKFAEFYKENI